MWFTDFVAYVPAVVQYLLFLVITLAITLIVWWLGRKRYPSLMVVPDGAGSAQDQANLTLGTLLTAFAFIAAFMLAQFWANNNDARQTIYDEQVAVNKVMATAKGDGTANPAVMEAINAYITTTKGPEAQAMRNADITRVQQLHEDASQKLITGIGLAVKASGGDASDYSDDLTDIVANGGDRQQAMPTNFTPRLFWVLAILGTLSLAMAVILAPQNTGGALVTLIGLATALVTIYFIALQAANPYLTGDLSPLPGISG